MTTDDTSPRRFSGRIALITGGSRGIGRATAERFASEGATVVVNYRRNAQAAAETVEAITRGGGHAAAIAADLESGDAIAAMFADVRQRFGAVDFLVANAAATMVGQALGAKKRAACSGNSGNHTSELDLENLVYARVAKSK
jgi:3-oxoacyl-[acyl-carrier protein] reductase